MTIFWHSSPSPATPFVRKVANRIFVTLHNSSSEKQSGGIGVNGSLIAKKVVPFTLAPKSVSVVEIPLKYAKAKGGTAILMLFCKGRIQRIPLTVAENLPVSGNFQMKNVSGTLKFGKDGIDLVMKVKDATDAGKTGKRSPWETDCVELFFDTDPLLVADKLHPQNYTQGTFRLFILPRDGMAMTELGKAVRAADCKIQGKCIADGYEFTLHVPVKCGKYLGFDVKIDDFNGTKKVTEVPLSGHKDSYQSRCNFTVAEPPQEK